MARRSAGNDRYRTEQKGQTRKSAGSLKPKREKGTIDSTMPKKSKTEKKKQPQKKKYIPVPSTPEIKKWRKVWWVAIIIALLAFGLAYLGEQQDNNTLRTVGLSIELAGVLVAINIDIFVIRRLRKEAILAQQQGKKAKGENKDDKTKKDSGKDAS